MELSQFFSRLDSTASKELNLNTEAQLYLLEHQIIDTQGNWLQKNPLINPDKCAHFIQWVHAKYQVTFSYGGYAEDRSTLWHDTYLDASKTYYHLGVDINIPA